MILQTSKEAQQAREAKAKPRITVKRIEVTRGVMKATVYPGAGTLFIETQSGIRVVLDREETRELQNLLNEQLGYGGEAVLSDGDKPDLDFTTKDEETK
jgi:hypothetical protein